MTLPEIVRPSYASQVYGAELAPNTREAYRKGWERFERWCADEGVHPLRASDEDVSRWLIHLAAIGGLHPGSIGIYRSAVNKSYEIHGLSSPVKSPLVRATMRIVRRDYWQRSHAVEALRDHHVAKMISLCPSSLIGYRDAAILAIGFSCALRRSELIGLAVQDVRFLDDEEEDSHSKMIVTVRQSKTDQSGAGQSIPVIDGNKIRPITRLRRWLDRAEIAEGRIFRTMKRGGRVQSSGLHPSDVPRLIKHYAQLAGLDPGVFSGHSLRAGFVTSAAAHRVRPDKIMSITRHTSLDMVLKYTRDADLFDAHAGESFL